MYRSTVPRTLTARRTEAVLVADQDEFEIDEDWVLYDVVAPHIARITINRPERRNAILSPDMHEPVRGPSPSSRDTTTTSRSCSSRARAPTSALATTFAGSPSNGPGSRRVRSCRRRPRIANARRLHRHLTNWLEFPKTVIAVCQGNTLGAGFNLVLAADLVIAGEGATFGRPQARIGFAGFSTAMPLVLLKLGANRGYEAMITGRRDHGRRDARLGRRVVDRSGRRSRSGVDALRARRSLTTRPTGS